MTFADLVGVFLRLLDNLVFLIFSLTFLVLVWKVIDTWILNAGEETKVTEGKRVVITAVWVLVVMIGIWGILEILQAGIFRV